MSDEPIPVSDITDVREGDILFDCPHCGKNMAIEPAGAGLMVSCPGCDKQVQVPIPDASTPEAPVATVPRPEITGEESPEEVIRQLDAALSMANEQIDQLIAEKEGLQERRAYLEQVRMASSSRFEQMAGELEAMQDALDRTLVLLAEARAEKPA